jgi:hypothetical protein
MTLNPTPPQPSTTAVLPSTTRAAFTAEPKPVITAHPKIAATLYGIPSTSFKTAASGTTACVAIVPSPKNAFIAPRS